MTYENQNTMGVQFSGYNVSDNPSSFRSTSTMQMSGSAYSANPCINASGMAVYTTAADPTEPARGGQRRIITPGGGGTQQPIGDALIPLILMVMAYATFILRRRRKRRV